MAERYGFFNSYNGDRKYSASFLAEWLEALISTGVRNGGINLQVFATGDRYQVTISPGKAWINGYYYHLVDAFDLAPEPAEMSTTRIDRVVLRLDLSLPQRKIYPYIKKGAAQPPSLERDMEAGFWEISLARIEILPNRTTIMPAWVVDERLNTEVCGIANSRIEADTTEMFNAFYYYYQEKRIEFEAYLQGMQDTWEQNDTDWNAWFNQVKADLGQTNVFDFDNLVRLPGFERLTTFNQDGSISESIKNTINQSVFATRETVFNPDGSIVEIISCPSVLSNEVQTTTTFNLDGTINEKVVTL